MHPQSNLSDEQSAAEILRLNMANLNLSGGEFDNFTASREP